jgi:hypothetical protein
MSVLDEVVFNMYAENVWCRIGLIRTFELFFMSVAS